MCLHIHKRIRILIYKHTHIQTAKLDLQKMRSTVKEQEAAVILANAKVQDALQQLLQIVPSVETMAMLEQEKIALQEAKDALELQLQSAPLAETISALERAMTLLQEAKELLELQSAPSAETMHALEREKSALQEANNEVELQLQSAPQFGRDYACA